MVTTPNINVVNLDHIFRNFNTKLSYSDYQSISEDFMATHIEEDPLTITAGFGFPKHLVKEMLEKGELNHATACYHLVANS
jgi:hypothetical protein